MPIGITEEHVALHEAVAGWAERHCPPAVPRALLDAPSESLPAFWGEFGAQGWLGLHVDEAHGGSGYGVPELAVVLEELGARARARTHSCPTVLAAAVVAAGRERRRGRRRCSPAWPRGRRSARSRWASPGALDGEASGRRRAGHRHGAPGARRRTSRRSCRAGADRRRRGLVRAGRGATASVRELPSVDADPARRGGHGRRRARRAGAAAPGARLAGVSAISRRRSAAAELVGVAQWCVTTAAEYAKVRVQFGRPIGQFQGVKHKCADMVGRVELARAAAWDAAPCGRRLRRRPRFTAAVALSLAIDAAFANAKDCIQVLGGIGFTWEHDAHMYMKRAMTMQSLLGPSAAARLRARASSRSRGHARRLAVDLGPEADELRVELRAFLAEIADARRDASSASASPTPGYIVPTWPRAVGSGREGRRAARDRRGVPRRQGEPARHHDRLAGRCRR